MIEIDLLIGAATGKRNFLRLGKISRRWRELRTLPSQHRFEPRARATRPVQEEQNVSNLEASLATQDMVAEKKIVLISTYS